MSPAFSPPFSAPPPLASREARSLFVTVFAWCVVAISALGSLVSAAALLMVIAGSPGAANGTLLGGFVVIGLPPMTLVAGVGLLRRARWAYAYILVLLGAVALWNLAPIIRGPRPQHTYTSASGVRTTVLATEVNYAGHLAMIALAAGLIAKLASRQVRAEFRGSGGAFASFLPLVRRGANPTPVARASSVADAGSAADATAREWRVGHQGRDEMYYEEWREGEWRRLRISGEMLTGRAHHVIYFASEDAWRGYPEWARHRRDEIIGRVKSAFPAPDYEYDGDGTTRGTVSRTPSVSAPASSEMRRVVAPTTPRSQRLALYGTIAVVFAITCLMGWLVIGGIANQETYLPTKRASQRRIVVRTAEPALYWVALGTYGFIGAASLGFGAWLLREACRGTRRSPAGGFRGDA